MKRRTVAQIFRHAAIWMAVHPGDGACAALHFGRESNGQYHARALFREYFMPRIAGLFWWTPPINRYQRGSFWWERHERDMKIAHEARILALLFAAEIAKDERI